MIALLNKLKIINKEIKYLGILFPVIILIFLVPFYKESFLTLLRLSLSIYLIYVVPGYCLTLYWRNKLSFFERIVVGAMFSAAVVGISSYYLGLIGVNIKYHLFILPTLFCVLGIYFGLFKNKKD